MSEFVSCLLCLNSCSDYKCLYDENGVYDMELYEITIKYFNTMFLTETTTNEFPVVCFKCWQYMFDFNNFQSLIIMTHEQLLKDSIKLCAEVEGDQRANIRVNESPSELEQMVDESIKMEDNLQLLQVEGDQRANIRLNESLSELEQMDKGSIKMEDNLQLLQVEGDQRANIRLNESLSELEQMDEGSIKIEDNLQLLQVEGDQRSMQNESLSNLRLIKEESFMVMVTTEPTRIPSDENITDIKPNIHTEEESPEIISSDENSQSANFNDIDSDPEWCDEISEPESDDDSISQQSLLRNPKQHSSPDNTADSQNNAISRKTTHLKKREIDEIIAKWKSNLECGICHGVVANFPLLRLHTKRKHPKMRCKISCCQRLHVGPSHIARHAILHMDPQCFQCHLCNKRFSSMGCLTRHRSQIHSMPKAVRSVTQNQKKCKVCGKIFARHDDMEEHEAYHMGIKLYTCLLCSKSFTYRSILYRHLKSYHPTEWRKRKGTLKPIFTKIYLEDVTKGQEIPQNN